MALVSRFFLQVQVLLLCVEVLIAIWERGVPVLGQPIVGFILLTIEQVSFQRGREAGAGSVTFVAHCRVVAKE